MYRGAHRQVIDSSYQLAMFCTRPICQSCQVTDGGRYQLWQGRSPSLALPLGTMLRLDSPISAPASAAADFSGGDGSGGGGSGGGGSFGLSLLSGRSLGSVTDSSRSRSRSSSSGLTYRLYEHHHNNNTIWWTDSSKTWRCSPLSDSQLN